MDGDINLSGSTGPVGNVGSAPDDQKVEEEDLINLWALSTLSESSALKLAKNLGIDAPSLADVNQLRHAINSKMSEIGADLWDKYLDTLARLKEEVERYEKSLAYRSKVEEKSTGNIAKEEDAMSLSKKATISPTEHQQSLPAVWKDAVSATEKYIEEVREKGGKDAPFMVSSLVVMSGQSFNVVDTVSTDMVAIKPIQDAATNVVPLMGPELQQHFNLSVNLFITGMVNYANVEAINNAFSQGAQAHTTKDTVLAFAHNVINKVQGNEINGFLMALLINKTEKGQPVNEERVNQIANMAKGVMVAIALAALYKFESGWITPEEFKDLLAGKMEGRTAEETVLVNLFNKAVGGLTSGDKDVMVNALLQYIRSQPSVEDLLDPVKAFAKYGQSIQNPQLSG